MVFTLELRATVVQFWLLATGAHVIMKPRKRRSWEETALILAQTIAECRSQDPYVQVGACAVLRDNSVSLGYNGPPPGIEIDWSQREDRGPRIIHAEVNALRSVDPGQCKFLAVTLLPCRNCMTFIASKAVRRVVYREVYERDTLAFELAKEFGIELVQMPRKNAPK
jgi:deoxycytidylate deaminase